MCIEGTNGEGSFAKALIILRDPLQGCQSKKQSPGNRGVQWASLGAPPMAVLWFAEDGAQVPDISKQEL